jgi:hypothetical protein
MKGNRPTKAQVEARVAEILRIRLDGAEIWDVREYVREKEQEDCSPWQLPEGAKSLSDSQLWRYIAKVDKVIAESCRASRKKLLRRHQAQRRNLYARAVIAGDVRTALACLDSEAKLQRLHDAPPSAPDPAAPDLTAADLARVLSARLREIEAAELPTAEKAKLTAQTADALLRAISAGQTEARLAALEKHFEAMQKRGGL